jgi:hypothetical protein
VTVNALVFLLAISAIGWTIALLDWLAGRKEHQSTYRAS